eukprot:5727020-Amphidinium_carterae.1
MHPLFYDSAHCEAFWETPSDDSLVDYSTHGIPLLSARSGSSDLTLLSKPKCQKSPAVHHNFVASLVYQFLESAANTTGYCQA